MKKKRTKIHRNMLVLALVAVYIFTATSHIFFIPCTTQTGQHLPAAHGNSIFKRKLEYVAMTGTHLSFIQRADKSTFEERRAVSDSMKSILDFFTVLFFAALVWRIKPKLFSNISDRLIQPRYSYLSLRVIRI